MPKSWKTTLCGLLALVAAAGIGADFGPLASKVFGFIGSIATGAGLLFARDANVTSEQQLGITKPTPPPPSLLLLLILAPLLCLSGCNEERDQAIANSAQAINNAAGSLPPSRQRNGIQANARAIAHAVGHDLPPDAPAIPEATP